MTSRGTIPRGVERVYFDVCEKSMCFISLCFMCHYINKILLCQLNASMLDLVHIR